ncbi:unnamed protein product [Bursaphelenchus okinawaensis]|uniref:Uncharacterized protein n=1 Tax=Bursaphelenchus okinawaensis TaxID=465554 RepID=A0A811KWF0_9BILA|nr:unnamed protein product [Bursaphelenchus okinawaensis]CAG9113009.1 unnamed protein product [Bursaphelenchus okinawaensis]
MRIVLVVLSLLPVVASYAFDNVGFGFRCSPNMNFRYLFENEPEIKLICQTTEMLVKFARGGSMKFNVIPPMCDTKISDPINIRIGKCDWLAARYNHYQRYFLVHVGGERQVSVVPGTTLNVELYGENIILNKMKFTHPNPECRMRYFKPDDVTKFRIRAPQINASLAYCPYRIELGNSMELVTFGYTQQSREAIVLIKMVAGFICLVIACVCLSCSICCCQTSKRRKSKKLLETSKKGSPKSEKSKKSARSSAKKGSKKGSKKKAKKGSKKSSTKSSKKGSTKGSMTSAPSDKSLKPSAPIVEQ